MVDDTSISVLVHIARSNVSILEESGLIDNPAATPPIIIIPIIPISIIFLDEFVFLISVLLFSI